MKTMWLAIALTVLNLALLGVTLWRSSAVAAQQHGSVLRGKALEIVDDQGRVRASITLHAAGPSVPVHDGNVYPETVVLRLIDPNGRPNVKLGASEEGSGLALGGDSDLTYVVLKADKADSSVKLTNKAGLEKVLAP
jgi:hypothetical protein